MNQIAKAVAALFFKGDAFIADAAKRTKQEFRTREAAKTALIPAFAANYPGARFTTNDEGDATGWESGKGGKGSKGTMAAKKKLNRLLSLAFDAPKVPSATVTKPKEKMRETMASAARKAKRLKLDRAAFLAECRQAYDDAKV